jgi:6-phosphogluconolactonase
MTSDRGAVRISHDASLLITAAADLFLAVTQDAIAARGRVDVALTGGSAPPPLHRLLATPAYADQIPWAQVHIWFGDDRCVGPSDPLSNFGAANQDLLGKVPLPSPNIHRIQGELPRDEAAAQYAAELRRELGDAPRLDLIWLGLGPDGHVASLFPGSPELDVTDRLVVGVAHTTSGPDPLVDRVSLTMPVLNNAALVAFLITGEKKAGITARVIEDAPLNPQERLPAQRVQPTNGQLLWLLDLAAAGDLHL